MPRLNLHSRELQFPFGLSSDEPVATPTEGLANKKSGVCLTTLISVCKRANIVTWNCRCIYQLQSCLTGRVESNENSLIKVLSFGVRSRAYINHFTHSPAVSLTLSTPAKEFYRIFYAAESIQLVSILSSPWNEIYRFSSSYFLIFVHLTRPHIASCNGLVNWSHYSFSCLNECSSVC